MRCGSEIGCDDKRFAVGVFNPRATVHKQCAGEFSLFWSSFFGTLREIKISGAWI